MAAAFSQRRKTLRNSLASLHPSARIVAALRGAALPDDARAQALSLPQFVALAWQLHTLAADEAAAAGEEEGGLQGGAEGSAEDSDEGGAEGSGEDLAA